jgi:endo-1,4-beta-xylanase
MRKQVDLLEGVLTEIENGLKDDITADTLADTFSMSSVHLQRLFKAAFNQPIGTYIRSRKLSASINDLLHSGLNVHDIALEYGFGYEQTYIISFKRQFGFTPGDLRRNRYLVRTTPPVRVSGLRSLYHHNFMIGNIINEHYMNDTHFSMIKNHFGVITPENGLKSLFLASDNRGGAYNWAYGDRLVNRMLEGGMQVHGHTLVFHRQMRDWLAVGTKAEAEDNLKNYITDVLNHYRHKIFSWDVVNEAFRDGLSTADAAGDWKDCLRADTPWYQKLGAGYMETAYRTAREAAPDVTLYYNDYGLENQNKAEAVRKMIHDINSRYKLETGQDRNLIEGLGMQSHYRIGCFNENNVRASLRKFISLNIELSISELDVSSGGHEENIGKDILMSEYDSVVQARIYARLFRLYREYSGHISRVTMWGIDDYNSWISSGNPCLFDRYLNPKKAFTAVFNPEKYVR